MYFRPDLPSLPGSDDTVIHFMCGECSHTLCGAMVTASVGPACPMCTLYSGETCPGCGLKLATSDRWVRL